MRSKHIPRWYRGNGLDQGPQVPLQRHTRTTIPEDIARLAHAEYALHHAQTFERLHERGGFGCGEIIMLLADALERAKAEGHVSDRPLT